MSTDIKTVIKIPDLWYDFFARLLPGMTAIGFIKYVVLEQKEIPTTTDLVVIIFCGYIYALLTQPLASRITSFIESKAGSLPSGDNDRKLFVGKIQRKLGYESREVLVIDKMHAEATFFVQLAISSLGYLIFQITKLYKFWPNISLNIISTSILVLLAWEVADRRFNRVRQISETLNETMI